MDSDKDEKTGRYINFYNQKIEQNGEDGDALFSLGLCSYKIKKYDTAREQFEKAIKLLPDPSEAYYFKALCYLRGRRPRVLTMNAIDQLEADLSEASEALPDNPIFDFFRAVVKYDYYHGNGLKVKPPKIEVLIKSARQKGLKESDMEKLWGHLNIRDKLFRNSVLKKHDNEESFKRRAINKYFSRYPRWTFIAIAAALVTILYVNANGFQLSLLNVICVIIILSGIIYVIAYYSGMPDEKRMDAYLAEDIERLRGILSKDALSIEESQLVKDSEIVYGPAEPINSENSMQRKEVIRYKKLRAGVILFGRDQLMCYSCIFDITDGIVSEESTDEYFYKDIVSVSTDQHTGEKEIKGRKFNLDHAEVFRLTTSGGTALELLIKDGSNSQLSDKPLTMAYEAVRAIRRMLRDKKADLQAAG